MLAKFKSLPLHWKIIIGLVLGFGWAILSITLEMNKFTSDWIAPWGSIFIRLLKLIAIPLVLFSIIGGVANLGDPSKLGKIGAKTIGLYMTTTVIAISSGLLLVNLISPGSSISEEQRIKKRIVYENWAKESQKQIKDGLCYSCKVEHQEHMTEEQKADAKVANALNQVKKQKEQSPLTFLVDMVPPNIFKSLANNKMMLQIIFFAIFFGICLTMLPDENKNIVLNLVKSLDEVFLKMVNKIMDGAPLFVFCLVAGEFSKLGNNAAELFEALTSLSIYAMTVFIGLIFMVIVIYPTIVKVFVPHTTISQYFKGIAPAQALAFSTSSSAATLPVTMDCVENNLKVKPRISSFVLPIGATINMDGSSLYIAVAVVFLAQFHMIDLTFADQMTILVTSALASIGTAAVPSASLVMMMVVLQTIDLNPAWIAIILPFDRILDMCRTAVNVTGDTAVCTVVNKSEV